MSVEISILASGSFGNCTVVRCPGGVMLIDLGLGPRVIERRLRDSGVGIDDIQAICLTHLDHDHFRPSWTRFIVQRAIPVFVHEPRIPLLIDRIKSFFERQRQLGRTAENAQPPPLDQFSALLRGFKARPFESLPGLELQPIRCDHDELGSHGFLIEGFDCRIGYATDLGQVPRGLIEKFADLHILALESNYDPDMQLQSSRPGFLKQRIMGGAGHLSNHQALAAIQQILDRCEACSSPLPDHIVLLHRSQQCNCPRLMRKLFNRDPRIARRLTLAEQHRRSPWLRPLAAGPRPGEQLTLAWG